MIDLFTLTCSYGIFFLPSTACQRVPIRPWQGCLKVRCWAWFWAHLSQLLFAQQRPLLSWVQHTQHLWVSSGSSPRQDSYSWEPLNINHNYWCSVHLPSSVSWSVLLAWCCASIVPSSIREFLCQWRSENNCSPNTPGSHLMTLTWKKWDENRKTNFQTKTNLLYELTHVLSILPHAGCSLVPPLAVASSAVLPSPWKNLSWGADSAICSLYKFKGFHEHIGPSGHSCFYSFISVKGIVLKNTMGLSPSGDCCPSLEILREEPEGSNSFHWFKWNVCSATTGNTNRKASTLWASDIRY